MGSSGPAGDRPSGRLAVCSWSLCPEAVPGASGPRSTGTPEALIEAVRQVGLDAVQLALVPVVEEPEVWGDAVRRIRDAGIAIVSGMLATVGEDYSTLATIAATGGVRPDATWPATLTRAARVAELAGHQGIRLVTFHAGFIPHDARDPEREVLLERLRTVIDLFAARGVRVAFETGQEEADTLLSALEDLRRPDAGVNFDPANMILYGMGDPVAALRKLKPWVRQVHIKDALPSPTRGQWGREVVVGAGAVDWRGFFDVLRSIARPLDMVIEREAGATRIEDVRRAAEVVAGAWG